MEGARRPASGNRRHSCSRRSSRVDHVIRAANQLFGGDDSMRLISVATLLITIVALRESDVSLLSTPRREMNAFIGLDGTSPRRKISPSGQPRATGMMCSGGASGCTVASQMHRTRSVRSSIGYIDCVGIACRQAGHSDRSDAAVSPRWNEAAQWAFGSGTNRRNFPVA